ncbi:hypothetical protein predicted by Glimmer/Critica [Sorangium cellulosum So ce56]|uniref:Uncharacterized protein n=1 Tax=Sorangium cellulosum (strain So ce56) TaxID=448385 RepID=A9GM60_SORC5|nr:hypothetical protein predicted by Glimmer/Critica [Sorangium cellulosum So ce56]
MAGAGRSPVEYPQPRYSWEAASVSGCHIIPDCERCRRNQEVVRTDRRALRREFSRKASVHACNHEIERNQRQVGEQPLDERLSPGALRSFHRSVNPVQELRCGDRRDGHRFVPVVTKHALKVQLPTFGRDEHAGVDQRSHGVSGIIGWFCATSSTASR